MLRLTPVKLVFGVMKVDLEGGGATLSMLVGELCCGIMTMKYN